MIEYTLIKLKRISKNTISIMKYLSIKNSQVKSPEYYYLWYSFALYHYHLSRSFNRGKENVEYAGVLNLFE